MKVDLEELLVRLEAAAKGLPLVTKKRMFGCEALFANGQIFGLIWKHGRIGVRLPDAALYTKLMDREGASPWKAGAMTMAHWVLVPVAYHDAPGALAEWVKAGHGLAVAGKKTAKKAPKATAKKTTEKPAVAAKRRGAPAKKPRKV